MRENTPVTRASLPLAWDGGHLMVTTDSGINKIARKRLSPSTSKAIASCPARFAADKTLRGVDDPFGAACIGTSAHAVFEDFYQLPPEQRTHEALAAQVIIQLGRSVDAHESTGWPGVEEERRDEWLAAVTDKVTRIWDMEDPQSVVVRKTEWQVLGEVAGVPFIGNMDRADIVTDGRIVGTRVVDYKSGKYRPEPNSFMLKKFGDDHADQLRLYTAAVAAEDEGVKPLSAAVYYTGAGKIREIDISERAVAKTVSKFVESWKQLTRYTEDRAFPAKSSALCGWCPLVNSCPVAARDDKVPRIDGLPTAAELSIPTVRPLPDLVMVEPDEWEGSPEQESDPTHHLDLNSQEAQNATQQGAADIMSTIAFRDDRPYLETSDGNLNGASYAAGAAFDLAGQAVRVLVGAGVPLSRNVVNSLASTFAHIIRKVQLEVSGRISFQDGLHSRLRYSLAQHLRSNTPPLGGDAAQWDEWISLASRRLLSVSYAALTLWTSNEDSDTAPYEALLDIVLIEPTTATVTTLTVAAGSSATATSVAAGASQNAQKARPGRVATPATNVA